MNLIFYFVHRTVTGAPKYSYKSTLKFGLHISSLSSLTIHWPLPAITSDDAFRWFLPIMYSIYVIFHNIFSTKFFEQMGHSKLFFCFLAVMPNCWFSSSSCTVNICLFRVLSCPKNLEHLRHSNLHKLTCFSPSCTLHSSKVMFSDTVMRKAFGTFSTLIRAFFPFMHSNQVLRHITFSVDRIF